MSCKCGNDSTREIYKEDGNLIDANTNTETEEGGVKHKLRADNEKKALMTRLAKIEGQVRGVKAMVEDDRYCVDILTQVSAIQAALNSFNKELLARHIKSCVADDIREGNEEAVDELCELLKKLMK